MERVFCRCFDGQDELLCTLVPVSFRLRRDEDAPADSMEAAFAAAGLPGICRVELWVNGTVLFDGMVDEQNETVDPDGKETELVCRSFEALLLDNQAAAGTVRSPSRAVMEHWQLRPLGLTCTGGSGRVFGGEYTVPFGASVYKALLGFASLYFGAGELWMKDRHTVSFSPGAAQHRVLPVVTAVEYRRCPAKRIGEVAVQSSVSGCYNAVTVNEAAQKTGVVRRRFLRANDAQNAAGVIASGEKAAFSMLLTVPGKVDLRPGDTVTAMLRPLGYKDLQAARVVSVLCSGTAKSMTTRVEVQAVEDAAL